MKFGLALIYLVSGMNKEGYAIVLDKMTSIFMRIAPLKGALSKFRKKISFTFFEEIYRNQVKNFIPKMETYKGYHLVGMDGDQYNLPPSYDILSQGYRGYPVGKEEETHYLKMYAVRCVDLLSGVVLNFAESIKNDEIGLAITFLEDLPKKTIAIFDRLYLSKRLIEAHIDKSIYFLARCKKGATFHEVEMFYASNKRRSSFLYKGYKIYLVKVKNEYGEYIVLATNLDISNWTNKELANVYSLRWDCESSNRDSTSTLKLEQWHTLFYNGIMQEIYVHLLMTNLTKSCIFLEGGYQIDLETNETKKSNFKLVYKAVINLIPSILKGGAQASFVLLRNSIARNIEKRKRLSRSYPRQVKKKEKQYKNASLVPRRT